MFILLLLGQIRTQEAGGDHAKEALRTLKPQNRYITGGKYTGSVVKARRCSVDSGRTEIAG